MQLHSQWLHTRPLAWSCSRQSLFWERNASAEEASVASCKVYVATCWMFPPGRNAGAERELLSSLPFLEKSRWKDITCRAKSGSLATAYNLSAQLSRTSKPCGSQQDCFYSNTKCTYAPLVLRGRSRSKPQITVRMRNKFTYIPFAGDQVVRDLGPRMFFCISIFFKVAVLSIEKWEHERTSTFS